MQVAGRGTNHEAAAVEVYEPITDTPYLFLEFARLVEHRSTGEALSDWIRRYGVPGFSYEGVYGTGDALQQSVPSAFYNDKGGTLDSFGNIWAIAWEANESLRLYEAAMGGDRNKLERVLFSDEDSEHAADRRQRLEVRAEATGASYEEVLVNAALFQLIEYASGALISYCYPVISYPPRYSHIPEDAAPPMAPDKLTRGWGRETSWGQWGSSSTG